MRLKKCVSDSSAALLSKHTFVRLPVGFPCAEASGADCSLQAQHVADIREQLRSLLLDGAIWLEEASGTLTHAALHGIKNCGLVLFGTAKQDAVAMDWPAPGTLDRQRPVARARDFFRIFDAYMAANFPNFEEDNAWAAFDLGHPRMFCDSRSHPIAI